MPKRYNFILIEQKWQSHWTKHKTFLAEQNTKKNKYYILDMFPYPSGQGLHVGHCLGYTASDIIARYHHALGYNVLHPMGFDAFGLPAEQYAIETGQHPATTTKQNITQYKKQLKALGLAIDWSKQVTTSDPAYYKWTQWLFLQLFESWYNQTTNQAEPITTLRNIFKTKGNTNLQAACSDNTPHFTAQEWNTYTDEKQESILHQYRLAYLADTTVNWCPTLGTVLANSEVKQGLSERGGHLVIKKNMKQWSLRITAYAPRLLADLDKLEWSNAIKTIQANWIGKSIGATVTFTIDTPQKDTINIFTTRPDTIFGTTYLALSSTHPFLAKITDPHTTLITKAQQKALKEYIAQTTQLSHDHQQPLTGHFTGLYAHHPLTNKKIPIWIASYVLATYGTGAIMGVPAHDSRDYAFAKHLNLPIKQVITKHNKENEADLPYEDKDGILINSDFLNTLTVPNAIQEVIKRLETTKQGKSKTCYRIYDTTFSRQRYWGEPIPMYREGNILRPFKQEDLPLTLPIIDNYKPTKAGEPPLARATNWHTKEGHPIEYNTMPAIAGSNWYFLRYTDPTNTTCFASAQALNYWQGPDAYFGGAEHATSHLLQSRFVVKFLYDRGLINIQEPFKKLINQGMIQGTSHLVYRIKGTQKFVSHGLKDQYDTTSLYVDINLVNKGKLNIEAFKKWRQDFAQATFILENGHYICGTLIEKMSKSKHNTIQPNEIIQRYGADTLRLYLMFLGPLTQSKPWNTQSIEGVHRFLKKVWHLCHQTHLPTSEESPTEQELKTIHKAIKEVTHALKCYTFNTAISTMMIAVNTLTSLKCNKRTILEDLLRLLAPFAPHLAEELWQLIGHQTTILHAGWPTYNPAYLVDNTLTYALAINGKVRTDIQLPASATEQEVRQVALQDNTAKKWLQGNPPKRIIIVPKKIINILT